MTINYIKLIILCILLIGLSACSEEEPDNLNGNGKQVTISLSIPGMEKKAPSMTYAMPADEDKINTVDVLVFKTDPQFPNDPSKGTYFYRATVTHTEGTTTFTAQFIEVPDNQTIVVLANCRTEVATLLSTISEGASKADVIAALSLTQSTSFDPAGMTGIPMWGEITNQCITSAYNPTGLSVKLTRMLAKIHIVNSVNTDTFALKRVHLYNPRQKGTVMPDNWNDTNSSVITPTIVAGANMEQGTFFTTTGANRINIYTFEADNRAKAAADWLDATCLVVGGIYKRRGVLKYYRIDLKSYATGVYYDILRNHSYNITITSVTGAGTDNPDEAYKGISTIKAKIEVWNDNMYDATNDFQYGSSGQLYISNRYPWIMLDGRTVATPEANTFQIQTSIPKGWKVKTKPSWVILSEMSGESSTVPKTIVFTVDNTAVTSPRNGREGKIVIESGDLEYIVYAMQGNCGMNGRPLVQTIGKHTYKTHLYPTVVSDAMECWMVENSKEGLIRSGRAYGLDHTGAVIGDINHDGNPSYRGLENGYYYTWEQRDNACPEGWIVPTKHQWLKLQTYINNGLESNEAIWWAGSRGAANNAFAGNVSGTSGFWNSWNTNGLWWSSSSAYQYSRGQVESVSDLQNASAASWLTVRCVRK